MTDPPLEYAMRCAVCDALLCDSEMPDERTVRLWLRLVCRSCGDRLKVLVSVSDDEVRDDRDGTSQRRRKHEE